MKNITHLVLLILNIILLSYGCASDIDKSEAYYKQGIAYADNGQFEMAIAKFNKAIELNPQLADVYFSRGVIYNKLGQYERAMADEDKVLQLGAKYATTYTNRGISYFMQKQYDRAIGDFNKAIEIDAELDAAYFYRGVAYYIKAARYVFLKDYPNIANVMGNIEKESKEGFDWNMYSINPQRPYDRAVADFKKVTEISNNGYMLNTAKRMIATINSDTW